MASKDHAERLPGLAKQIAEAVDVWSWQADMYPPSPAQRAAADVALGFLDQLLTQAALARYALTGEISAAEQPDVLAGAEG